MPLFAAFLMILQIFTNAAGQDINATIRIVGETPSVANLRGRFTDTAANERNSGSLLLVDRYADRSGLARRVTDVRTWDDRGQIPIEVGRPGEFIPARPVRQWSYRMDLKPPPGSRVHVSWLNEAGGVLFLDDLLPQGSKTASITIEIPSGWKAYSTAARNGDNTFNFDSIEKASIVLGPAWRERTVPVGSGSTQLLNDGDRLFTDEEAAKVIAEVQGFYENLLGREASVPQRQIVIAGIPGDAVLRDEWQADTRGTSILIASTDMPFRSQAVQRLHEQLRHEIFHFWIPNGVNLTGSYDWFYEGFALYQSLKLGVAVNRIRFEDMLDTLSRAYEIDIQANSGRSLLEASKSRWEIRGSDVYARGLLVAFLSDLALLYESNGKRSSDDLLREIYKKHKLGTEPVDANWVILRIFTQSPSLAPIAKQYVTDTKKLDILPYLRLAGLELVATGGGSRISVAGKPSGRQKDILDKLGYNSWRKLAKSK